MEKKIKRSTGDFKKILKYQFEISQESGVHTTITLEQFVYTFLDYYIDKKDEFAGDLTVINYFKEISAENKLDALEYVENTIECYQDEVEIPKELELPGVSFDPILETILDTMKDPLTSQEFLETILTRDDISFLVGLRKYLPEFKPLPFNKPDFFKNPEKKGSFLFEKGSSSLEKFLEDKKKGGGDISSLEDLFNLASKMASPEVSEQIRKNNNEEDFEKYGQGEAISSRPRDAESLTPILDQYAYEMTRAAEDGKFDPVVGRDDIIDSMIEDMCKRKKANVILLGDAGVGKSAIVECLAQKIVDGKVPDQLRGKRIFSLNLNDLVAGTKYRGEYEARLQGIIKEVINDPNIIIYIDEFHNLAGNGGERGNGDGANILKPYLARGEFKCIGSTTLEEYRKFIEKDAALKRRFTEIIVTEPNQEETFKILKAISKKYEEYHQVRVSPEVLRACVEWSGRYITDRYFPDKAIDVLDKACSYVKISRVKDTKVQDELLDKLDKIIEEKTKAVMESYDFKKGEELRQKEIALSEELDREMKHAEAEDKKRKNWPEIKKADIAGAVSKLSKVPVDKISKTDNEMLKEMKEKLEKRVIGQAKAIDVIVKALQKNYLGLRDPGKPILSALFVGPSGVGKTLICKEVARIFFGSEKALIKIDMNNMKTEMDVTRLIGASAGYVGYEDEPLLLKVKRQPRSLVLLDEIEKAHSSIFDLFMDILDEGVCTLADGTKVDFTNTVIIFTGNIGTKELKQNGRGLGFENTTIESKTKRNEGIVQKAISNTFRPEFINRLGTTVVFNELGETELGKIYGLELQEIKRKLGKGKYHIQVKKELRDYIISLCDPIYGARDLKRNIEKYVVDPISAEMLEDPGKTRFLVDIDENKESVVK